MTVPASIDAIPSGSLVPIDWVREQLRGADALPDPDSRMTVSEMADRARVAESTMRGFLRAGKVAGARRVGKRWTAPAASFEAWLAGADSGLASDPAAAVAEDLSPAATYARLGRFREVANG